MTERSEKAIWRLHHIKKAITNANGLLAGRSIDSLRTDEVIRAACERFLEIISEASRYIPEAWRLQHPAVPWRQVQDLGNVIRHVYHRVEAERLWTIYEDHLGPLEAAIDAMLAEHEPKEKS